MDKGSRFPAPLSTCRRCSYNRSTYVPTVYTRAVPAYVCMHEVDNTCMCCASCGHRANGVLRTQSKWCLADTEQRVSCGHRANGVVHCEVTHRAWCICVCNRTVVLIARGSLLGYGTTKGWDVLHTHTNTNIL